jgi:hypothetical protein
MQQLNGIIDILKLMLDKIQDIGRRCKSWYHAASPLKPSSLGYLHQVTEFIDQIVICFVNFEINERL